MEDTNRPELDGPLGANCSFLPCLAPAGDECKWADDAPKDHPRFHAERIASDDFYQAVVHHQDAPQTNPDEVKRAFEQVASDLF